jgi:hypothetical protein
MTDEGMAAIADIRRQYGELNKADGEKRRREKDAAKAERQVQVGGAPARPKRRPAWKAAPLDPIGPPDLRKRAPAGRKPSTGLQDRDVRDIGNVPSAYAGPPVRFWTSPGTASEGLECTEGVLLAPIS